MFETYFKFILFLLAGFVPIPTDQHFVWPLSSCLLADICNHTWIPECGAEVKDFRLFIDECDMYEYDCDHNRTYQVTNYTDCFGPATGCPTLKHNYIRIGNYKYLPDGRRMIYEPTYVPTLPMHMLRGKRRYTPQPIRKITKTRHHISSTRPVLVTKKRTVVLKRLTFMKGGKIMVKIFKGFSSKPTKVRRDSDFLEN